MRFRISLVGVALLMISQAAQAALVQVSSFQEGSVSNTDTYSANGDPHSGALTFTGDSGAGFYRSFATFDLTSLAGETITGATIDLAIVSDAGAAYPAQVQLWDVSTMISPGPDAPAGLYTDLGTGVQYGTANLTTDGLYSIDLTNALADLNSGAGGILSIGFSATATPGQGIYINGFNALGNPASAIAPVLNLTTSSLSAVPEPASMATMGLALVGFAVSRMRRKKLPQAETV